MSVHLPLLPLSVVRLAPHAHIAIVLGKGVFKYQIYFVFMLGLGFLSH